MKKVAYLLLFFLCVAGLAACEALMGNCRVCRFNTYENGMLINSTQEAEYCDEDLLRIQGTLPQTIGETTYKWECD